VGDVGCDVGLEGGDNAIVGGWWWLRTRIYEKRCHLSTFSSPNAGSSSIVLSSTRQLGPTRDQCRWLSFLYSVTILLETRNNVYLVQLEGN
jgi:hypothetical protein